VVNLKTLAYILELLDTQMTRPEMLGWFHILWLIITTLGTVLFCRYLAKDDDKYVNRVVLITSVIVAVLEIYKQINYTFCVQDGVIVTDYQWYAFPFQFCSTPMYAGLVAGVLKKCRVRDALYAFLATYGVFAGLCVMIYPNDVFCHTLGINIQTMICHGSMIVLGVYLLFSGRVKLQHKTILKAVAVFSIAVGIASVMNEIAFAIGIVPNETFNMFFISPHFDSTLPVYGLIQPKVPFILSIIIYIVGFSAAAYLILLAAILIKKLSKKFKEIKEEKNA
jgi:hypothetical protein